MSDKIYGFVGFIIGGLAGSAITYKLVENKIQNETDREIESIREYYKNKHKISKNDCMIIKSTVVDEILDEDEKAYDDILCSEEYINNISSEDQINTEPIIISVNEFGQRDNYNEVEIIYYDKNKVFVNDDEILENPDDVVGKYCREIFENNLDLHTLYVRNDEFKTDYEIIRSFGEFYDND